MASHLVEILIYSALNKAVNECGNQKSKPFMPHYYICIAASQSEISDSGQNSDQISYLVRKRSEIYTQVRYFDKVNQNAGKLLKAESPFWAKIVGVCEIPCPN